MCVMMDTRRVGMRGGTFVHHLSCQRKAEIVKRTLSTGERLPGKRNVEMHVEVQHLAHPRKAS